MAATIKELAGEKIQMQQQLNSSKICHKNNAVLGDANHRWDTNLRQVSTENRKSGTIRKDALNSKKCDAEPIRMDNEIVTVWFSKQCS